MSDAGAIRARLSAAVTETLTDLADRLRQIAGEQAPEEPADGHA
jgi:hypothetical protein